MLVDYLVFVVRQCFLKLLGNEFFIFFIFSLFKKVYLDVDLFLNHRMIAKSF